MRKDSVKGIPLRDPATPDELVDLSPYYNAALTKPWHAATRGNDLTSLPTGIQTLAGTKFDIRGLVQLAGRAEPHLAQQFPKQVRAIRIEAKCDRLHFLHATGWYASDGSHVGSYIIRYADGEQRVAPIIYGFDVLNWWYEGRPEPERTGLVMAWKGENRATEQSNNWVRLFKTTWTNPRPDVEIKSIDYVSTMGNSAPFLVALTTE